MFVGKFTDFYRDVTKKGTKISQEEYKEIGSYPIIDQGKKLIAGRWDNREGVFDDVPAIIFGDHTRAIKYIEEPFFIGADGVKILRPTNAQDSTKYLYYALQAARIPNLGYSRHFKALKELEIRVYSREEQDEIVRVLDKIDHLIEQRYKEISCLNQLVKSRFIELFGDPKYNKSNLVKIGEIGSLTSGGTPSRAKPEYFEGDIRWYSAGELNSLYLPDSVEHISKTALQESSAKLFNKGTLMIGMYDTAAFKLGILTENSSSNQACANLNPQNDYNVVWLYYLFDIMKPIFLQKRQGVRQKNLSLSKIKEFEVPNAPIGIQNHFAAFVTQVDKSKYCSQKFEELCRELIKIYEQEWM